MYFKVFWVVLGVLYECFTTNYLKHLPRVPAGLRHQLRAPPRDLLRGSRSWRGHLLGPYMSAKVREDPLVCPGGRGAGEQNPCDPILAQNFWGAEILPSRGWEVWESHGNPWSMPMRPSRISAAARTAGERQRADLHLAGLRQVRRRALPPVPWGSKTRTFTPKFCSG